MKCCECKNAKQLIVGLRGSLANIRCIRCATTGNYYPYNNVCSCAYFEATEKGRED